MQREGMMSLRVKVELALIVAVMLIVGLGYAVQQHLLRSQLKPLEEDVAMKDMARCLDALKREGLALGSLSRDWAARPDIQSLLRENGNSESDSRSLQAALDALSLDFAYVLNGEDAVVWKGTPDAQGTTSSFADVPPEFLAPNVASNVVQDTIQGLVLTKTGPVFFASSPVREPADDRGRVVLGRVLNQSLLGSIYHQSGLAFQVYSADTASVPNEARQMLGDMRQGGVRVLPLSGGMLRVYATYPSIDGTPGLLLQTDLRRDVLAQTHETMVNGLLAEIGIGLAALIPLIVFFRNGITNPLLRLTRHVTAIAHSNDLSARLRLQRNDEIGILGSEFDRMVEQLEADRDIQRQSEEALRESQERFTVAVDGANDGLWDWNLKHGSVYYSPRWKSMLGYNPEEIGTDPEAWFSLIHRQDRPFVQASLDAHLQGESDHLETEYRILHKDGTYLWMLCRGLAMRGEDGTLIRMAGSQTDISARKRVEEQLAHQAFHDTLTGLPNRALFLDRLSQAMRHAKRTRNSLFAVLFLDLDRFKVVNDGLGHVIGDKLLKAFASVLTASFRANDTVARFDSTVARFGGDEFVVLLDAIRDISDASRVAERILELLKKPFQIEEHEVFTSVSIGIAISAAGYETPEEFLRNADTAMYRAKGRGKACYEVFDLDMHARAMERLQLETDLRRAIEREEFCVYYQPIVSLSTGRIEAFEALVRWNHPTRGMISPAKFIPVAEETGMILPIGEFVFRSACAQTRAWQKEFPYAAQLNANINLSVKEFVREDFVESTERTLSETGLQPRHLNLEITESAVMENVELVSAVLLKLRALNIQLSIDDFGTGYSSLSYLHRFPLDNLKIDQVFVKELRVSAENELIVRTILMLARNLRMDVIAEGIETPEQLRILLENHCDYGQGDLFTAPLDVNTASELLAQEMVWESVTQNRQRS